MTEIIFLVAFAAVLFFTGVNLLGVMIALAAGLALMAVFGLLAVVIKLLPWLIVIAIGVWIYRHYSRDNDSREKSSFNRHR